MAAKLGALLEVALSAAEARHQQQEQQQQQPPQGNVPVGSNSNSNVKRTDVDINDKIASLSSSGTTTGNSTSLKLGSFNTVEAGLLAYIKLTAQIQRMGLGSYRDDVGYEQVSPSESHPESYLLHNQQPPRQHHTTSHGYPNLWIRSS